MNNVRISSSGQTNQRKPHKTDAWHMKAQLGVYQWKSWIRNQSQVHHFDSKVDFDLQVHQLNHLYVH